MLDVTLVSFIVIMSFFIVVVEAVRRGVLETKYSLLWILITVILGILSLSKQNLEYIAKLLGVHYAPSVLFLLGFIFSLVLIFDLTRRISKLNHQLVTVSQEHAIQKQKLDNLIKKINND